LKEYINKGVPNVWLIDPRLRIIWTHCPPTLVEVEGDAIATTGNSIPLSRSEIFAR
jgi:hypothetical protein